MNSYERVKAAIEFTGPDRLPIAGNCMRYDTHGDVVYHFPQVSGNKWWLETGGYDEWGCFWESTHETGMGQVLRHPLKELAKFEELPKPDGLASVRYSHLDEEISQRPDAYHVLCNGSVFFERMHFLRGFDQVLMDMMLEPAIFNKFAEWIVAYQLDTVEFLAKHFNGRIHGLRCTDDLGTQASSIMSPLQFREHLKPLYASLAGRCHESGLHFWMHSCGKIDGLLDDLIDASLDVVHVMQPQVFDLEDIKPKFAGRMCFEAYPDLQRSVPTCDRETIKNDIGMQLKNMAVPQGGYIAGWLGDDFLKAECSVKESGLSDFITRMFQELDPYKQEVKNAEI